MKKLAIIVMFLLAAIFLTGSQQGYAYLNVTSTPDGGCLICHTFAGGTGNPSASQHATHVQDSVSCTSCHVTPGAKDVTSSKCIECHLGSNPGPCDLVNLATHPKTGAQACLTCHATCASTTTTTVSDNTTTTTTTDVCDGPSAWESATNGSCLFYFSIAQSYYCMDFTGSGFTPDNSKTKCETSPTYTNPVYSTNPCSQRTTEIAAYMPGYLGLTGICVIHCQQTNEFIWNIYTANPEASCSGFDFFPWPTTTTTTVGSTTTIPTTTSIISSTTTSTGSSSTTTTTSGGSTTTTTISSSSTTTTSIGGVTTTTTTISGRKPCPAKQVLGANNPKLENLRDFRDSKLAQSAIGRKVIQTYYNNADSINAALDHSPVLRAITRRVLEVFAPMVGSAK